MVVWKFPIEAEVSMPVGAELLHAGLDGQGTACVWARVDPTARREMRQLLVAGTGHDVPGDVKHVGTFMIGALVFHVFDLNRIGGGG